MAYAIDSDLGVALRELRQARGLSMDDVSGRIGVSKGALSAWENGKGRPRGVALERLLDLLEAEPRVRARLLSLADPRHARVALADSLLGVSVDVGMVLRVMRERRRVSQVELARRIGVSQAAVSKWEKGDTTPTGETMHALGFALGATVEETLALASAAGQGHGLLPEEPSAALAWMGSQVAPHALRETVFLGWEAELGRRAARDARWDPALVFALAGRAAWLSDEERYREITPVAQRAIRLATTPEARLQAVAAIAALADADRHLGRGHEAAAELAETWVQGLPESPQQAWMLRQSGMSLVRLNRTAEGIDRVARSAEIDLRLSKSPGDPWCHRTACLCDAYLEAGEPKRAAASIGGRRERGFYPGTLVRVEHANGRAATNAEMAFLRFSVARDQNVPITRRQLRDIERRQAQLTGTRVSAGAVPAPVDPGAGDRLWNAVLSENRG